MFFGSGVLLSVVFMTKLTGIVLFVPIVLYILFETYSQKGTWDIVHISSRILILITGFFFSTAIFLLWFYVRGALSDLIYTLFVYDAAHFRSALTLNIEYPHLTFAGFIRRYLFLLIPALLSLFVINDKEKLSKNILLLSWFFSALLGFFMQGRFYHYHMLPVIAPLSIMGAQGCISLWGDPFWHRKLFLIKRQFIVMPLIVLLLLAAIWPHILTTYQVTVSLIKQDSAQ